MGKNVDAFADYIGTILRNVQRIHNTATGFKFTDCKGNSFIFDEEKRIFSKVDFRARTTKALKGKEVTQTVNGYNKVRVYVTPTKSVSIGAHDIVAIVWHALHCQNNNHQYDIPRGTMVCHKNANKLDNSPTNIEFGAALDNRRHAVLTKDIHHTLPNQHTYINTFDDSINLHHCRPISISAINEFVNQRGEFNLKAHQTKEQRAREFVKFMFEKGYWK